MVDQYSEPLTKEQIDAAFDAVTDASKNKDGDQAWLAAAPLLSALSEQRDAARALLHIVDRQFVPRERRLEILQSVATAYADDLSMLSFVGELFETVCDIDFLNSPPPTEALFAEVIDRLVTLTRDVADKDQLESAMFGLASGARAMGRQYDQLAERTYKRLIELDPERSAYRYNLGLFYKTRGRFEEGLAANQRAVSLAEEPTEGTLWNLGICATGAGEGAIALDVWKRLEQKIEMGRFDFPDGSYPQCKIRLAERPLAERDAAVDDPGLEETIWIERLSPCHGIIRSVLYQDLGVDYGDVVLFDGAPITYHTYGDRQYPVFPHLATLRRRGYRTFDFAGTQDAAGRLADVSADLERDSVVYSHTENYQLVCRNCWSDPDRDHDEHDQEEKHAVTGQIAAPPGIDPADLLAQIDAAIAEREPCRIYSPDLCEAAGVKDRSRFERRRFDLLWNR